jgi:integrase
MRVKLTATAVARLRAPTPNGRQEIVWDTDLRGFGILISGVTPAMSYVVQKKLIGGASRRITIGATNVLPLAHARTRALEILREFSTGKDPRAERKRAIRRDLTLAQALDDYLARNKELTEQSRRYYRRDLQTWCKGWLDRPLREIDNEMVRRRHEEIAEAVKKGGRGTGGATSNGVMRALRAVYFSAAESLHDLPPNPVRLKKSWFPTPRRERMVRPDELPAFYKAVDELPSRTASDYIKLLLFTGLRRVEAAGLRWSEIDLAERVIRLPAGRTKANRKLDLPMSDYVRDLLIARRAIGRDGAFVFPGDSRSGHLVEPSAHFGLIAKVSGIRVSAHDLRRTFITVASGTAGVSQRSLKALVNHSLGTDVTAGYDIVSLNELREPMRLIGERLVELCGIEAEEGVERLHA